MFDKGSIIENGTGMNGLFNKWHQSESAVGDPYAHIIKNVRINL